MKQLLAVSIALGSTAAIANYYPDQTQATADAANNAATATRNTKSVINALEKADYKHFKDKEKKEDLTVGKQKIFENHG